jgi:hypothetical protein
VLDEFGVEKPQAEIVQFYTRPVLDKEATLKEGRPVHKDGVYVRITLPGDRTLERDQPIYESDKQRYPRQYAAFLANTSQESVHGTMLSAWGHLSTALVEDYRFMKVLTVEQLASVPDSAIHKFGLGARDHRQAAQDYIEAAKSRAPMLRLQKELEEERAQRLALAAQMQQLFAQMAAKSADGAPVPLPLVAPVEVEALPEAFPPPPRRRGRPAKAGAKEAP